MKLQDLMIGLKQKERESLQLLLEREENSGINGR